MKISKFSPKLVILLLIILFFAVSLIFRINLPHEQVFVNDWIKFTGNDAYYYMRLADNTVNNFPHTTGFDPYFIYPGGSEVGSSFFLTLLSFVIWVIGLGSPSQHTVDVVGVYFPAVLAALTVIPVFFIGKALFNRWVGVLAAGLVAMLPGEYLGRSILGGTDHHVAETFFITVAVLFFILAIKEARKKQLTFNSLKKLDWNAITKPLIYSLLAGVFLGLYLLTWLGALILVFIVTLYFVIQFIIDHVRHRSTDYLGIVGFISFLVTLIIYATRTIHDDIFIALVLAVLIPLILTVISLVISRRGWKTFYYPVTLIVVGIVGLVLFYLINPSMFGTFVDKFRFIFLPFGSTATTTLEMQPFLSPGGSFSTAVAWGNFTTSFFLFPNWAVPGFACISLFILFWIYSRQNIEAKPQLIPRIIIMILLAAALLLIYFSMLWAMIFFAVFFVILIWLATKRSNDDEHLMLFFIWSIIIVIATLVQRRFAYYLVINIALLSAYISWQVIWLAGLKKLAVKSGEVAKGTAAGSFKDKVKKKQKISQRRFSIYYINTALAIIVVFFFVFYPNINKSKEVASSAPFAPSDAWQSSLLWMKDNTPEPFGDPDAYYRLYEPPPVGENFTYPSTAYGVTSWWDYGYWITRIAHRLPSTNPSQASEPITKVANLFLSQNETRSQEIMKELDSSYIIADNSMSTGKFWAIVNWAGLSPDEFTAIYYVLNQGQLVPVQVYEIKYYQTLLVRLYNFNGQAVVNGSPVVITYDEKVDQNGNYFRQVTDVKDFPSYQEAVDYINSQESGKHDIVGANPFISPIPLEALNDYEMVYSSQYSVQWSENETIPEVKIFKYLGD